MCITLLGWPRPAATAEVCSNTMALGMQDRDLLTLGETETAAALPQRHPQRDHLRISLPGRRGVPGLVASRTGQAAGVCVGSLAAPAGTRRGRRFF